MYKLNYFDLKDLGVVIPEGALQTYPNGMYCLHFILKDEESEELALRLLELYLENILIILRFDCKIQIPIRLGRDNYVYMHMRCRAEGDICDNIVFLKVMNCNVTLFDSDIGWRLIYSVFYYNYLLSRLSSMCESTIFIPLDCREKQISHLKFILQEPFSFYYQLLESGSQQYWEFRI